jgi:predicted metal-dependent hydrolase
MLHLLEPTHNKRFQSLFDKHLPRWRDRRRTLNRLPVRHEKWTY